jgi:hypothetical protein
MPKPVTWNLSADEALKPVNGRLFATTTVWGARSLRVL